MIGRTGRHSAAVRLHGAGHEQEGAGPAGQPGLHRSRADGETGRASQDEIAHVLPRVEAKENQKNQKYVNNARVHDKDGCEDPDVQEIVMTILVMMID